MKLSAPVYRLKRRARLLSRQESIPHHAALDRIAVGEGFGNWSLLAARMAAASPARTLLRHLRPGDLLLVGARPGHGKTLFGLELAVEAMKAGRQGAFFTLEYTQANVLDRFRAIGAEPARFDVCLQNSDAYAPTTSALTGPRPRAQWRCGLSPLLDRSARAGARQSGPQAGVVRRERG